MREHGKALHAQFKQLADAEDSDDLAHLADALTAAAANHDAQANVYDQLVTAEPSLSDEHRNQAEKQRANACEARKFVVLVTSKATSAGTRKS
ncbi:hypothetical protein AR457_33895 [Streptomyces agglomeratus]|uniref:Uncharacterized protein n=1 Tax=Streptomyces agglomeratus TaxID=285458 RepID=A0A1E5PH48_9ACTN|nr:hypothetical protein [Streptomyces agglomeratus]OEJ28883.1 hypothetical protein AS594_35100 [Streptomyces agglomeratus]OEJ37031.1 hypothetical protein BGK70_01385 [Streptomyces agglomeratus]OEJ48386.1 hypothetical protein AR457_33895 [Streptomyces agglomeratus]OEJ56887.1 hypothetical protein BGM19_01405 [Streptomyces agglomeratus]